MDDLGLGSLDSREFATCVANLLAGEGVPCEPEEAVTEAVNANVVIFLQAVCANVHNQDIFPECSDQHRRDVEDVILVRYAKRLVASAFFARHGDVVVGKLVLLVRVQGATTTLRCFCLHTIRCYLHRESKTDSTFASSLEAPFSQVLPVRFLDLLGFKPVLLELLLATDTRVLRWASQTLMEWVREENFTLDDLAAVDQQYLELFVDFDHFNLAVLLAEEEARERSEQFEDEYAYEYDDPNYLAFQVLLVLNEQFVIKFYERNHDRTLVNTVFKFLVTSARNDFVELLLYYFNRERSTVVVVLVLKYLYLMFTTSFTINLFYTNDLKVLVDILLRGVADTPTSASNILDIYLKVLYAMLRYTPWLASGYKRDEAEGVLDHIVANLESENTKNLAAKCLAACGVEKRALSPYTRDSPLFDEEVVESGLQAMRIDLHLSTHSALTDSLGSYTLQVNATAVGKATPHGPSLSPIPSGGSFPTPSPRNSPAHTPPRRASTLHLTPHRPLPPPPRGSNGTTPSTSPSPTPPRRPLPPPPPPRRRGG